MFRYFIYITAVASMVAGVLASGALPLFSGFMPGSGALIDSHLDFNLQIAAPDLDESVTADPGGEDDNGDPVLEDDNAFGGFASKTWVWSKITPGAAALCARGVNDCTGGGSVTGEVRLRRNTSISADHLEVRVTLDIDNSGAESNTEGDATEAEMAKKLVISAMAYAGDNCLAGGGCFLADFDLDGVKTLNDLDRDDALDNLTPPPAYPSDAVFSMTLKWAEDSAMAGLGYGTHCGNEPSLCDNAFQGDSLTFTVEFTLNDEGSQ
jgi:hypothetical protein